MWQEPSAPGMWPVLKRSSCWFSILNYLRLKPFFFFKSCERTLRHPQEKKCTTYWTRCVPGPGHLLYTQCMSVIFRNAL